MKIFSYFGRKALKQPKLQWCTVLPSVVKVKIISWRYYYVLPSMDEKIINVLNFIIIIIL